MTVLQRSFLKALALHIPLLRGQLTIQIGYAVGIFFALIVLPIYNWILLVYLAILMLPFI